MINISYIFEQINKDLPIKLLKDQKDIKKFIGIFKDASPKYNSPDVDIYAVVDENHRFKFVGGVVINKKPKIDIYKQFKLKPEVVVSFVYVMSAYRKHQLGLRLLRIPMEKYKSIGLTTNKNWTRPQAYRVYEHLGFKEIKSTGVTSYWYWEK